MTENNLIELYCIINDFYHIKSGRRVSVNLEILIADIF